MIKEKDYKTSSLLSGLSFFSFLLVTGIYSIVLYNVNTVKDADFSIFPWLIPVIIIASFFSLVGFIFSIFAMRKMLIGQTVTMMVFALIGFLSVAGTTLYVYFRITGTM